MLYNDFSQKRSICSTGHVCHEYDRHISDVQFSDRSRRTNTTESGTLSGGFASITTEQDGDKIVITIVKEPGSTPADGNVTLPEVPEGPIIIVPNPDGEGNGTVIIPEPTNETTTTPGGNETTTTEPPIVVIPPDGNVTQVEQPSNVTVIDNDTVIITPPTDNITEIPIVSPPAEEPAGNVTTEEPTAPAGNETTTPTEPDEVIVITPPGPVDCGCPEAPAAPAGNETAAPITPEEPIAPGNETTVVTPAPGENVTVQAPANDTGPTLPIDDSSEQPYNNLQSLEDRIQVQSPPEFFWA